jgi:LPS-assembly protein
MQSEWRHRVLNGSYSVRVAGIFQTDKEAFAENGPDLGGDETFRGSVRTSGAFSFNERWSAGWTVNGVTDRLFNRDYAIADASAADLTSTAYLTGLSERNYFDVRGYHFLVQRADSVEVFRRDELAAAEVYTHDDQAEQAVVHPVIDHNYVRDEPFFGGEVRYDSNLTSLSRGESDLRHPPLPLQPFYAGYAGNFTRASSRASWRRQLIAPGGQLITPFAYLQADLRYVSFDDPLRRSTPPTGPARHAGRRRRV